ncbi:MAG: TIR domain-containing protein [Sphingomicrobium sp.]
MADVFLSYARGDRVAAERLANAIGETGLTVWWDRHIKGGAEFSSDIERQLDAATRVLVLWSKEAVVSRWVRDEASVAADTKRLVSATVDGTPPPLGFRQFQTIDLTEWAAKGAAIPRELNEALEIDVDLPPAATAHERRRLPPAAVVIALLIAMMGGLLVVRPAFVDRMLSGETQKDLVSLVVMPFTVSDNGGEKAYLGPGLAGELASSLSDLSGVRIAASTSTQAVARRGLTAPDIARELGITHLIEGNIQRNGNRYAIAVRLINAQSSEQMWTRSFEGAVDELQALKARMARELAGALSARLGVGQGDIAERRNVDPRAFEAYLRALERVSVRDEDEARLEAIKQFRLAATIEPNFADAHAGYAYLMALSVPQQLGMSWNEIMIDQRRATARALKIDPANDLALVAKATALLNINGDVDQAIAIVRAVLNRSPNFGPAHYSLASGLLMAGRPREALDHLEQAVERDPFDMLLRSYRGKILYSLGDYEAVRGASKKCREECSGMTYLWFQAMVGFATPAQYREDFPLIVERVIEDDIPEQQLAELRGIAERLILGRRYALPKLQEEGDMDFPNAAIAARMISFDEGLLYARVAVDLFQPDSVIDILNDGRVTFTPEQRADPRYHQLFRHPKLIRIAAARRKERLTAGLPVFPVKTYAGR